MPPWLSAFLVLCIVVAFGTYVIYGTEGFVTAELQCRLNKATCENKCGSSNAACFTACGDVATKCYATAVAAATVANTSSLQGPFMNSAMRWADSNMLGNRANDASNGSMYWTTSAGNSTSIPVYSTDLSTVYHGTPSSWSTIPSSSKTPSSTSSTPSTPSTPSTSSTPSSPWDGNRDRYSSGWPPQYHSLENDGSYDSSFSLQGLYAPSVTKLKPHEFPKEELPGVTVDAPTDQGTMAADLRDSVLTPSLQQLIRDDAQDTVDSLFRNQYEIQYT